MTAIGIPANAKQLTAQVTAEVTAQVAARFQPYRVTEAGPEAFKRKAFKKD